MMRISLLVHKFSNKDQKKKHKKRFWRKILGLVLAYNRVFRPGTKLYSLFRRGALAVFWGSTGPKIHSSGTGPVTFFWGTILAWGHTFHLRGYKQ